MVGECKLVVVAIVGLRFCGVIFLGCSVMGELGKNGCTLVTKFVGLG